MWVFADVRNSNPTCSSRVAFAWARPLDGPLVAGCTLVTVLARDLPFATFTRRTSRADSAGLSVAALAAGASATSNAYRRHDTTEQAFRIDWSAFELIGVSPTLPAEPPPTAMLTKGTRQLNKPFGLIGALF